ncbi:MAG: Hsp20/alpha crystallin family protein [Phycisphaerae bacterium]|nr:Hsp20/alpha crystallin family protein [Phycisphaerae bacterium]
MQYDLLPRKDLFDKMADEMGAIRDSIMEEMKSRNYFCSSGRDSWDPSLNLYELDDRFIVCVDLAGMQRAQINVQAEKDILHIRGVRPKPEIPDAAGDVSVLVMEIDSGKFHRKVHLPDDVDIDAMEATYRNGYVWIILPRIVER